MKFEHLNNKKKRSPHTIFQIRVVQAQFLLWYSSRQWELDWSYEMPFLGCFWRFSKSSFSTGDSWMHLTYVYLHATGWVQLVPAAFRWSKHFTFTFFFKYQIPSTINSCYAHSERRRWCWWKAALGCKELVSSCEPRFKMAQSRLPICPL